MHLRVARVRLQGDAIEGADIDAELACGTVVGIDNGLGDLLGLLTLDDFTELVLDCGNGAINRAYPALDTSFRMDPEQLFLDAADRVGGTLLFTERTANALVCDEIRHIFLLVNREICYRTNRAQALARGA